MILVRLEDSVKKSLTQERLKELLEYNEKTGVFIWKKSNRKRKKGSVAGCYDKGYWSIGVDTYKYMAHILAWLYMEGYFPENIIDHKNRNRSDNRWCNLRHVSHSCNAINIAIPKNNKSGVKGVCYENGRNKWRAEIRTKGKSNILGRFELLLDAVKMRYEAEVEHKHYKCDSKSSAYMYLYKRGLLQ